MPSSLPLSTRNWRTPSSPLPDGRRGSPCSAGLPDDRWSRATELAWRCAIASAPVGLRLDHTPAGSAGWPPAPAARPKGRAAHRILRASSNSTPVRRSPHPLSASACLTDTGTRWDPAAASGEQGQRRDHPQPVAETVLIAPSARLRALVDAMQPYRGPDSCRPFASETQAQPNGVALQTALAARSRGTNALLAFCRWRVPRRTPCHRGTYRFAERTLGINVLEQSKQIARQWRPGEDRMSAIRIGLGQQQAQ